jgi:hypothetical protein
MMIILSVCVCTYADIEKDSSTSMHTYIHTRTHTYTQVESGLRLHGHKECIHTNMHTHEYKQKPAFEYVGTKILSVTPRAGMLNPGSGGLMPTISVGNLPGSGDVNVTIATRKCTIAGMATSDSPIGRSFLYLCCCIYTYIWCMVVCMYIYIYIYGDF